LGHEPVFAGEVRGIVDPSPCFDRILAALRHEEPDCVPPAEVWVDKEVRDAFLGRPIQTLEDEAAFWLAAGYDFVCLDTDLWATPQIQGSIATPIADTAHLYQGGRENRGWVSTEAGIVKTWDDVERFPWPKAEDLDYSQYERIRPHLPAGMKVLATCGHILTAAWQLMGFEHFCLTVIQERLLVREVMARIGTELIRQLERMLSYDTVGGICFQDDIAYTSGVVISPKMLRELFFPWLADITARCHARGRPLIFHSDGKVDAVIPDIIAAGADALHAIEPKCMDIVAIKREYGDRLALVGNVDLSYTLTRGTPQEVEDAVKYLIRHVAPGGGFLLGSCNSITNYVPLENYRALLKATQQYGRYPITL
jgi:uroporphyrinogen decarboxylase